MVDFDTDTLNCLLYFREFLRGQNRPQSLGQPCDFLGHEIPHLFRKFTFKKFPVGVLKSSETLQQRFAGLQCPGPCVPRVKKQLENAPIRCREVFERSDAAQIEIVDPIDETVS